MADSNGDAPTSSVVLDPVESLTFQLQANVSPQAVLTIRNISEARNIAFKVKTTRPMRYLVRPNQGMLGPNMTASIMVILQQKDCDELLRLDPSERQLSNDKFLVQSSYVDDSFYELVKAKQTKEMSDDLTSMWSKADKKSLANKKLRCRFVEETVEPIAAPSAAASTGGETTTVGKPTEPAASAQPIKSEEPAVDVSSHERLTNALLTDPPVHSPPGSAPSTSEDAEVSVNEVAALKRKYDSLVAYTVQITAQRQQLMADLERAREELAAQQQANATTLRQRRTGAGATAANAEKPAHDAGNRTVAAKETSSPFFVLCVVAVIAYLLGRYF